MQMGSRSSCTEIKELSSVHISFGRPTWAVFPDSCVFWPVAAAYSAEALKLAMVVSLSKQFVRQVLTAQLDSRISF